mgnify:CR=1 FL=1
MRPVRAVSPVFSAGAGRPITPPIAARCLRVHHTTVLLWIREKHLSAVNISTRRGRPSYQIYRDDLWVFLRARGMTDERFRQVFLFWFPPITS